MSNILNPQIVVIGTRRYRKNPTQTYQQLKPYEEETEDMFIENRTRLPRHNNKPCSRKDDYNNEVSCRMECEEDDGQEDYKDIKFEKNIYRLKMPVSQAYFGFIIGRNRENKNTLERDTNTIIHIPSQNSVKEEMITIEGKAKANVASCRNRVSLLVNSARETRAFTHLLTFPINFEPLKAKFSEFRDLVLRTCGRDRGVDDTIFQVPNKFHLTLCTLTLLSKEEKEQARQLLEHCRRTFISELAAQKELRIRVQGLEYMNDDPSSVDVLYAKINAVNGNGIQEIADKLLKAFVDVGLAKKHYDRVKLHATVMNTLKRQEQGGGDDGEEEDATAKATKNVVGSRKSFDSRQILNLYKEFDFGEFVLHEIHMSLRISTGADGYYEFVSRIKF